jgi:hypothetical protein
VLEALPALAQLRIGLQAVREPGEPRVELTAGLVMPGSAAMATRRSRSREYSRSKTRR